MGIRVTLLSAVDQVTGACTLIEAGRSRVLVDLGLVHGDDPPPDNTVLPIERPDWLDAVVLTHAHVDHCGRMPMLARHGFAGPVFMSRPTADLLPIVLHASARVQRRLHHAPVRRGESPPPILYDTQEVDVFLSKINGVQWNQTTPITADIDLTLVPSGHVLGAASVVLTCRCDGRTRRILVSGDLGPNTSSPIPPPAAPPEADLVVMECTRGDVEDGGQVSALDELRTTLRHARASEQIIIAPVFALGRTQSLLHRLAQCDQIDELNMPVVLDSAAGVRLTNVHDRHSDQLNEAAKGMQRDGLDPLRPRSLRVARSKKEAAFIRDLSGPAVILAGHGFAEGGAVLAHLKRWLPSSRARLALIGYMAPNTLGGRLADDPPRVKIEGKWFDVQAPIDRLDGFSGHADAPELQSWLSSIPGPRPVVVLHHGDATPRKVLADVLTTNGWKALRPEIGQAIDV